MKLNPVIFKLLILTFIGFNNLNVFALKTKGYIITLNSDTILGLVQLSRFDQITGNFILNGIEEESFYSRVVFKNNNKKKFKCYFPEMIIGFGFSYDSIDYIYNRVLIERKSMVKKESLQYCFMRSIYKNSDGERYKSMETIDNPGLQSNTNKKLKFNWHLFRINKLNRENKNSI